MLTSTGDRAASRSRSPPLSRARMHRRARALHDRPAPSRSARPPRIRPAAASSCWVVHLAAVVTEDLDIPVRAQPCGRLADQMRQQRHPQRGVARLQHRVHARHRRSRARMYAPPARWSADECRTPALIGACRLASRACGEEKSTSTSLASASDAASPPRSMPCFRGRWPAAAAPRPLRLRCR